MEDSDEWDEIERKANEGSSKNNDSSDDSDDEDDSEDEIKLEGKVEQVSEDYTFEFNDMRDEYTTGIRTLLRSVISNPTEAYSLADRISAQKVVGTVINCEGGDDAFAFATVLPLTKVLEVPTVGKILAHLAQCVDGLVNKPSSSSSSKSSSVSPEIKLLHDTLSSGKSSAGILLHQRFSNLPIELIGPLHRNLEEDLSWAQTKTHSDDDNDEPLEGSVARSATFFSDLAYVLLLCPVGASKDFDVSGVKAHSVLGTAALTFDSFEDEVYFQHAEAAVVFKPSKACGAGYEENAVVAALVPVKRMKDCVKGICALLPDV